MGEKPQKAEKSLARRLVRSALFVLGGTVVGCVALVLLAEESFIYFPSSDGDWTIPQRSGGRVEDVRLTTEDGVSIHGWYYRASPATKRTILYFHGNAGNLAVRHGWTSLLSRLPANVLVIDYRGYGRSEGQPSERGLYLDAEAAWRHLVEERGVSPSSLVLYGKSLGGGPACELASRKPCAGLILQSTYTSMADMASTRMLGFPLGWFCTTKLANVEKVPRIAVPKLFIHSRDDDLIPFWMAEDLHRRACEPKRLVAFVGPGHNDLIPRKRDELIAALRTFLDEVAHAE